MSDVSELFYLSMLWHRSDYMIFYVLHTVPCPPSLMSLADVANTFLAITWKGPPGWTNDGDSEMQCFPRDVILVFNPYSNRKSEVQIMYSLHPGRSDQFNVKTVSGDTWKTYSRPISGSQRTSTTCLGAKGKYVLQHLIPMGFGFNPHFYLGLVRLNLGRNTYGFVYLFNSNNNEQ